MYSLLCSLHSRFSWRVPVPSPQTCCAWISPLLRVRMARCIDEFTTRMPGLKDYSLYQLQDLLLSALRGEIVEFSECTSPQSIWFSTQFHYFDAARVTQVLAMEIWGHSNTHMLEQAGMLVRAAARRCVMNTLGWF